MNAAREEICNSKHIAVIGVSDKKFGGAIYKTLKKNGYTVYPVHPNKTVFDGDRCFPSVKELPEDVKMAIVAVSAAAAIKVTDEAIETGLTHLWFQQGADFSETVAKADKAGIKTVSKKCILMYAQPVTGIHAFHRFLARLFGKL